MTQENLLVSRKWDPNRKWVPIFPGFADVQTGGIRAVILL